MNKKNVNKAYSNLYKAISPESIPEFIKLLKLLSQAPQLMIDNSAAVFEDSPHAASLKSTLRNKLTQLFNEEKKFSASVIIIESYKLAQNIEEIEKVLRFEGVSIKGCLHELKSFISSFSELYEIHTRKYSLSSGYELSVSAQKLLSVIEVLNSLLESYFVHSSVSSISEEIKIIDLYLPDVRDLKRFGSKLLALNEIYIEILKLLGKSEVDHPIEIITIESGSLWTKITGQAEAIKILIHVLMAASAFFISEFSNNGEIAKIPITVKAAEDILNLSKQLEDEGADMEEVKEYLVSATKNIARNLDKLLSDQSKIEINDESKSLCDSMSEKMLEQSKAPLLEIYDQKT
ncbi:hypothetical protein [Planctobacterium marinum]|uniref:hypothetical protein n=1 Tax=Planctobacterium marinum TaxID=1631968 RepID=UPI001E2AB780|nr:hypothetical protein [Planctobacterium marinum]MCC2607175.1 hypothetical protein [Planctobacterium marinum]